MKIESILVWPRSVCLGWAESAENKSTDTHHSASAARAVCDKLITDGFGCDRQIYPLEARVEVDGKIVWRWTDKEGLLLNNIESEKSMFSGMSFPPMNAVIRMPENYDMPSCAFLKESAYERANPNQPWYAQYRKRNRR